MDDDRNWYLSTSDNKYNYFSEYDKWEEFDESNGYFTSATIARLAPYNPYLPDELNAEEFKNAMQRIYDTFPPFTNSYGEPVHYIKCYEDTNDET